MECVCFGKPDTSSELFPLRAYEEPKPKFTKQASNSKKQNQTLYHFGSRETRAFEVFDSFRKNEQLCDVKLETDDGTIVHGHKVVLATATPYFQAMFTNFKESNNDHVVLRELDSAALKILVDFIYSARIMITEENVKVLIQTANRLMLHDVEELCCDFLLAQLNPTNCFSIKSFVSQYDCEEYLSNVKSYIQQNFRKIADSNEFLSLSYEEIVELISCNELNEPSEEKIFECVINWVNYDSSCRKDVFPKLMEHVRLPLVSNEYLLNKVKEESLIKNSFECRNYLNEALRFQFNSEQPGTIPEKIRITPRMLIGLPKIILAVTEGLTSSTARIQWYNSSTNEWKFGPVINIPGPLKNLTVLNDTKLFFLNGTVRTDSGCNVYTLDLHSEFPSLKQSASTLINRIKPGIGVLDNCIYAIGGVKYLRILKSAEVFNFSTKTWKMIRENMSTARHSCGVGVLNKHVFVIGGVGGETMNALKSVECFCTKSQRWISVKHMKENRSDFGVGVLNGLIYAVGGFDGRTAKKSVEAYNPLQNVWASVSDMNKRRRNAGVVVLNGYLYAVGGEIDCRTLYSAERYDPETDSWCMISKMASINILFGAVVTSKPLHF